MESPYPPCRSKSQTAARPAPHGRRASSATWSASLPLFSRPSGASLRLSCANPLYLAIKYAAEVRGQALRNRRPRSAASQLRHGSHGLGEAARNNVLKIAQVGRDVERETVRCDPSADVHADGGDFALAHPDARQFRNTARLDTEIRQRIDERLFDRPHIRPHVALPFAQVQDGIA